MRYASTFLYHRICHNAKHFSEEFIFMKHAFLIMAHSNFPLLSRLLKKIDHINNMIYIHIDAKSTFSTQDMELLKNSCQFSTITFIERYKITWGSYSQINLELRLLEAALADNCDYYHFLSGNDFLIQNMKSFHQFFEKHSGYEFVNFSSENFLKSITDRFTYYHFFRCIYGRNRKNIFYWFDRASIYFQKRIFHTNRTTQYPKLEYRCGANWCSITHEFSKHLLSQEALIKKMFKHTTCADEVFLQTILYNSPFMERVYGKCCKITGSDACLRSIDWSRPGELEFSPHVYTCHDYEELIHSNNFICRKVTDQTPDGEALIQKLELL